MKAIILAAGYGTRLYPLTLDHPKPLLTVGKKTILEFILDKVKVIDEIDSIYVVTNEKFFSKFEEWKDTVDAAGKELIIVNDHTTTNEDRLGAVGDIHYVIQQRDIDDDVMVLGGDNIFDFSLKPMVDKTKAKNASIVALHDLKKKELLAKKFGVVELDADEKIVGFEEKPEHPKTSITSTACYIFSKQDVHELEICIMENKKPDNIGDFIKYISEKGNVYGCIYLEGWFDIGSFEALEAANKYFSEKYGLEDESDKSDKSKESEASEE